MTGTGFKSHHAGAFRRPAHCGRVGGDLRHCHGPGKAWLRLQSQDPSWHEKKKKNNKKKEKKNKNNNKGK